MGEIPMPQELFPDFTKKRKWSPWARKICSSHVKFLKAFALPNSRSDLDKTCQT